MFIHVKTGSNYDLLFLEKQNSRESRRAAKFACPRVLDDQQLNEDNQKFRFGCPPDSQILLEKTILKIIVHTNSLSFDSKPFLFQQIYHFGNLKNNLILNGIKMRATKNMSRTTRFPISVVLRLPTFDSNFATLSRFPF